MRLLLAIPYNADDWQRAEALMDWHREMNDGTPNGHVLLVASAGVHAEITMKLRITAELAFESVREFQGVKSEIPLLGQVAAHVAYACKWPWLWCDGSCLPLTCDWLNVLWSDYDNQPMRYMGPHLQVGESKMLAQCSVYPPGAIFDMNAKRQFLPLSTKTRKIQVAVFNEGDSPNKIRPDAVLLSGNKSDSLISVLRKSKPAPNVPELIGSTEDFSEVAPAAVTKRRKALTV